MLTHARARPCTPHQLHQRQRLSHGDPGGRGHVLGGPPRPLTADRGTAAMHGARWMQSRPSRVRTVRGDGRGRARERWEPACAENSGWTHRTQRGMTWGGREWRAGGVRPRARQRVLSRSFLRSGIVLRRVSGVKLGRISRWIFSSCAPDKCQTPGPHREAVGVMPKSPQRVITRSRFISKPRRKNFERQ